jgi:hypothetical protein
MADDLMEYGRLVEDALRGVVYQVLTQTEKEGLPGEHHFYISCRTNNSGMVMPDHLRESYPEEITLVLENQFWDLEVGDTRFSVTLSFGGRNERLTVPYDAITGFVDPSVEFGLQFKLGHDDDDESADGDASDAESSETGPDKAAAGGDAAADESAAHEPTTGTVVELDTFRKK